MTGRSAPDFQSEFTVLLPFRDAVPSAPFSLSPPWGQRLRILPALAIVSTISYMLEMMPTPTLSVTP